jgi:hypothetical protein
MRRPIAPAVLDLLLMTKPLIDQAKGAKREAAQRAWINCMNTEAAAMLDLEDEGRLPTNPLSATRLLLRQCLQLAKSEGMDGVELQEFFNGSADRGGVIEAPDRDQAIRRCLALLGVLSAQHLAADAAREVA